LNIRGFIHVHRRADATGITAHHPSQTRLQNARIRMGRTVKRRITLHGFAWRSHVALSNAKIRAIFRSRVII
jgi:hypothetical protein